MGLARAEFSVLVCWSEFALHGQRTTMLEFAEPLHWLRRLMSEVAQLPPMKEVP
jgi:hypothetical protein